MHGLMHCQPSQRDDHRVAQAILKNGTLWRSSTVVNPRFAATLFYFAARGGALDSFAQPLACADPVASHHRAQ